MTIHTVLIVVALIAFAVAAVGFSYKKIDLIAVGLAAWALSGVIGHLSSLSISTILLILALIAFVLAAIGWKYKKLGLIAIGLALWMLSLLL
jgi:hypothetical protein